MKTLRLAPLLAVLMMLGLTACPQTSVPRNFGGKPLALKAEEWEGTWRTAGENDDVIFKVKDAAAGLITIMDKDDKKEKGEPDDIVVRETGAKDGEGRAFMIVLSKPDDERGSVVLITVPEKGVLHFWNLRDEAVEAAVKSGELKGEIKEVKEKADEKPHNHTSLSADPANYDKLMEPKFWEWSKPGTFVRAPGKQASGQTP